MINQITGQIININQNNKTATLLNNGIGFEIRANMRILTSLKRSQELTLHVATLVREDGISLYGFLSQAQKELFEKLLKVSGVGPKAALSILEVCEVEDFISAVIKEDATLLASAQGIGKKTAQRIILELKNAFKNFNYKVDDKEDFSSRQEVYSVLSNLGLSMQDINDKLKNAKAQNESDDVESLVRFCLAN